MTAASSERTGPVQIGSTVPLAELDTPFVPDPAQLERSLTEPTREDG
jgi:hypothetical protein